MTTEQNERLRALLSDLLDGALSTEGTEDLRSLLKHSQEARHWYRSHMELHARLYRSYQADTLLEEMPAPSSSPPWRRRIPLRQWSVPSTIAAVLLLTALLSTLFFVSKTNGPSSPAPAVATLLSSENAAWESILPTLPGSALSPGALHLKAGVATIRFTSGAEVILEAPTQLVLQSPMRARLDSGTAVLEIPESAIGFTLETPNGYAIDYGTRFSVSVDSDQEQSSFEVIAGEISVHSSLSNRSLRLTDQQAAAVSSEGIEPFDAFLSEGPLPQQESNVIRLSTRGQTASAIRNGSLDHLHPDLLMAKQGYPEPAYDRRSLFAFDLSSVDHDSLEGASLRLNLVPSGLGLAAHLPRFNRFSLYGVPPRSGKWDDEPSWEDLPTQEEGILVAQFDVPRSKRTGSYHLSTPELLTYLKTSAGDRPTFLLLRETPETETRGLVHAFASDSHPEASGPQLELISTPSIDHPPFPEPTL
ncbi:MAG: FecR domain-containing protein [Verrucomicrobiota bacterium]